tara:strand:+ start:406 stop:663 length:258 start_codon:yes stop_codon:yes gene_type:complete
MLWALIEKEIRKMEKRGLKNGGWDPVHRNGEGHHKFVKRAKRLAWDRLRRAAKAVPREKAISGCKDLLKRAKSVKRKKGAALTHC